MASRAVGTDERRLRLTRQSLRQLREGMRRPDLESVDKEHDGSDYPHGLPIFLEKTMCVAQVRGIRPLPMTQFSRGFITEIHVEVIHPSFSKPWPATILMKAEPIAEDYRISIQGLRLELDNLTDEERDERERELMPADPSRVARTIVNTQEHLEEMVLDRVTILMLGRAENIALITPYSDAMHSLEKKLPSDSVVQRIPYSESSPLASRLRGRKLSSVIYVDGQFSPERSKSCLDAIKIAMASSRHSNPESSALYIFSTGP